MFPLPQLLRDSVPFVLKICTLTRQNRKRQLKPTPCHDCWNSVSRE
ncbi:MAG: hypothetical protein QG613_1279 [Pseudomonadota bacterium]|nr:hypothetical protein [Pseudomonadota bacterium]